MSILSKIISGIAGRNVSLFGWPMAAAGIGPGGEPLPMSVDGDGKLILSNGAAIPNGVPIAPNQAFANAMAKQCAWIQSGSGGLDFSNCGVKSIDPTFFNYLILDIGSDPIYLNGNALDQNSVDGILQNFANIPIASSYIDLSGGTNASPTPYSPHQDEILELTIPDNPGDYNTNGDCYVNIRNSAPHIYFQIAFDSSLNLSDSYFFSPSHIGIADAPSASAMAAVIVGFFPQFLATFFQASGYWFIEQVDGSATIRLRMSNEEDYPILFGDTNTSFPTGVTYNEISVGQLPVPNSNLTMLVNNGCTVITN